MTGPALNLGGRPAGEMAQQPDRLRRLVARASEVERLIRQVVRNPLHGIANDAESDLAREAPGLPEAPAPVRAVVRGRQLARALALRLGLDPDAPAGLSKVTVT